MIKDFPKIISVYASNDYKIEVAFSDGISGKYDLSKIARSGLMSYWNNIDNFKKVCIKDNILCWNEDIEIDSNSIYLNLIDKTFFEYA